MGKGDANAVHVVLDTSKARVVTLQDTEGRKKEKRREGKPSRARILQPSKEKCSLITPLRTYYILHPVHSPSTIAACGGWSFRQTLYGGNNAPSGLRLPAKRNPQRDRASIRAIFTHPAFARQGLGTMMMRYCEARAAEGNQETEGFARLEMGATLSGVALYERCGYARSGREDVVPCPNGEGIRVVHMVKDLAGEAP